MRRDLPILLSRATPTPWATAARASRRSPQQYESVGVTDVTCTLYPGARHEIFNETNRDEVTADVVGVADATCPPEPAPEAQLSRPMREPSPSHPFRTGAKVKVPAPGGKVDRRGRGRGRGPRNRSDPASVAGWCLGIHPDAVCPAPEHEDPPNACAASPATTDSTPTTPCWSG